MIAKSLRLRRTIDLPEFSKFLSGKRRLTPTRVASLMGRMHRPTIGILALLLLISAAALFPFAMIEHGKLEMLFGACLRVGILMSVVWLAQPQLNRVPWWFLAVIVLVVLLILAVRNHARETLLLLGAVVLVLRFRHLAQAPRENKERIDA